MRVHHNVIYGADNRAMQYEVQGRVRGRGSGGTVTKGSPLAVPAHPANKMVRLQKSDCRHSLEFKAFSRENPAKRKKKERKTVQDTPLEPLLINFTSYQTVVL